MSIHVNFNFPGLDFVYFLAFWSFLKPLKTLVVCAQSCSINSWLSPRPLYADKALLLRVLNSI